MTLEILNTVCTEEERTQLLPTAEIFREVIIEFLTAGTIDIGALQNEQSDYLMDASDGFVLNEMLLGLMEAGNSGKSERCLFSRWKTVRMCTLRM